MSAQAEDDFTRNVERRMIEAGLSGAALVSPGPGTGAFGDAMATFSLEQLSVRVVRDRGEEFLDIGRMEDPDIFFQWDDVEIAMGWRSVGEVVARDAPEPLARVLARVARRLPELRVAFSPEHVESTQKRVREAERARGEAFVARLGQG